MSTNSLTTETKNIKMLIKAVTTALNNTDFEVFVIFDGKKEELNIDPKVNILEHRHRLYNIFEKSPRNTSEWFIRVASGAFLRTEIPYLMKRLNFNDKYVLYTDYDVVFQRGDYSILKDMQPDILACATEFEKDDWSYFNTGVMIINAHYFQKNDDFILDYIYEHFEKFQVWDQTLYNNLYKEKFDKLPLEYNWKTYWGINPNAKIIHFHGAKPSSIEPKWRYNVPHIRNLREKNKKGYNYYNSLWESI